MNLTEMLLISIVVVVTIAIETILLITKNGRTKKKNRSIAKVIVPLLKEITEMVEVDYRMSVITETKYKHLMNEIEKTITEVEKYEY